MKLHLGYLAASAFADWSIMYAQFEIEDYDSNNKADFYSRVPVIEVYRYTDNSLVATLNRGDSYSKGFYSEFLINYDRTAMYFKIIAPTVRLTMTSF